MLHIDNPFIQQQISNNQLSVPDIAPALHRSYSQQYEDIIIESLLLAKIGNFQQLSDFFYIDIGANHPVSTSNTFLFYEKYNMRGILVEANPLLIPDLENFRYEDIILHSAVVNDSYTDNIIEFFLPSFNEIASTDINFIKTWYKMCNIVNSTIVSINVPCIRMNEVLSLSVKEIAILSIDIEGADYGLLNSIDFGLYKPMIIVLEPSNFYIPDNEEKMTNLLKTKGYSLAAKTPVNSIYQIS